MSLNREIEKVSREMKKEHSEVILKFLEDLEINGISSGRRYAYVLRLRKIETLLGDNFLNPSTDDVKKVIYTIQHTKVRWGSGEPHFPTSSQQESYKVALKRFYRWLLCDDERGEYPKCVKFISIGSLHKSREIKPEQLISPEEIRKIIDNSLNPRDEALFSLLYDSGCRLGELLTLRLKDVTFDNYGAKIVVSGKTGVREVRILGDSITYLRSWFQVHPLRNNLNSPVFCTLSENKNGGEIGRSLTHPDVYSSLKKILRRAKITRRIHPHLFRHTRATELASKPLGNAVLEDTMGWVHGSRQTQTYVHLSGKERDNAILKAYGIQIDGEKISTNLPKKCPRCDELNPSSSIRCKKCWLPLTEEGIQQQESDEIKKIVELISSIKDNKDALVPVMKYLWSDQHIEQLLTRLGASLIERDDGTSTN